MARVITPVSTLADVNAEQAQKASPGMKKVDQSKNFPLPDQRVNISIGGGIAAGQVIAENFYREVKGQAVSMFRFLQNIVDLNQEGRKAFRVQLMEYRKDANATVKGMTEKQQKERMAGQVVASAFVRISEAITFSKAVDAGFNLHGFAGTSYHAAVKLARAYLQSHAVGPTRRVGRKPATVIEKAQKYLANLGLKAKDRHALAAWIEDGAKLEPAADE